MTPTPTPGAAAELPVVCWLYHDGPTLKAIPDDMMGSVLLTFRRQDWCRNESALTYLNDAQAQLDALREEVARLTKERDEAREVDYFAELAALKAQPTDVDALMALAQDFANAHAMAFYADPELEPDSDEIAGRMKFADAAREALRAKLAARKEEL